MISFTDQIFEDQQRKSIEFCAGVDPGFFVRGGALEKSWKNWKKIDKILRKLEKISKELAKIGQILFGGGWDPI